MLCNHECPYLPRADVAQPEGAVRIMCCEVIYASRESAWITLRRAGMEGSMNVWGDGVTTKFPRRGHCVDHLFYLAIISVASRKDGHAKPHQAQRKSLTGIVPGRKSTPTHSPVMHSNNEREKEREDPVYQRPRPIATAHYPCDRPGALEQRHDQDH
jgi:hypothetical protein